MNHPPCTLTLPTSGHTLLGHRDGRIELLAAHTQHTAHRLRAYQFSGAAVQWLLATPDEQRLIAGHDDGLVVVFDAGTGQELPQHSCQLQSEYRRSTAHSQGELSADGRWLFMTLRRDELDVGLLIDLHSQQAPRRLLMRPASLRQPRFDLRLRRLWVVTRAGAMRACALSGPAPTA